MLPFLSSVFRAGERRELRLTEGRAEIRCRSGWGKRATDAFEECTESYRTSSDSRGALWGRATRASRVHPARFTWHACSAVRSCCHSVKLLPCSLPARYGRSQMRAITSETRINDAIVEVQLAELPDCVCFLYIMSHSTSLSEWIHTASVRRQMPPS